jgi:hypothetical protein
MTSTQTSNAISAMYEHSAKNPSYSVYEITSDGRVMTSAFQSKTRAFEYAREFTDMSSQVYVYKTKCIKVFDPLNKSKDSDNIFHHNVDMLIQAAEDIDDATDPDYIPSDEEDDDYDYSEMLETESFHDLTGLNFSEYGKGFLLKPKKNTTFRGEKYLMDGWWNDSLGGWVFKLSSMDNLIAAGASYSGKSSGGTFVRKIASASRTDATTTITPSMERNLTGFTIEPYGKGVILRCDLSRLEYSTKMPYLLGKIGWWNANGNGWFFQTHLIADLERLGAKTIKQEDIVHESPTFTKYGKGWILSASDIHTYKEHGKYYKGGFWMPSQSGWFFRTKDYEAFSV